MLWICAWQVVQAMATSATDKHHKGYCFATPCDFWKPFASVSAWNWLQFQQLNSLTPEPFQLLAARICAVRVVESDAAANEELLRMYAAGLLDEKVAHALTQSHTLPLSLSCPQSFRNACPVCMADFSNTEDDKYRMLSLPCMHAICQSCIARMGEDSVLCVVCRQPVDDYRRDFNFTVI